MASYRGASGPKIPQMALNVMAQSICKYTSGEQMNFIIKQLNDATTVRNTIYQPGQRAPAYPDSIRRNIPVMALQSRADQQVLIGQDLTGFNAVAAATEVWFHGTSMSNSKAIAPSGEDYGSLTIAVTGVDEVFNTSRFNISAGDRVFWRLPYLNEEELHVRKCNSFDSYPTGALSLVIVSEKHFTTQDIVAHRNHFDQALFATNGGVSTPTSALYSKHYVGHALTDGKPGELVRIVVTK